MSSTLTELSQTISIAVETLNRACEATGNPFPGADVPFSPATEKFRSNPEAAEAASVVAAAAAQLVSMVLPPQFSMLDPMTGHLKSAVLRVCLEANVTEILREAGTQGAHIDEIAKIANVNSATLARALRYLSSHHIYKELSPNVFANTRISSVLDTGKTVNEIKANPDKKHDNTPGFAAFAGHFTDELAKASSYLWETVSDPITGNSMDINHTPLSRAFNFDGTLWTFFDQAEQRVRQNRFGNGMRGIASMMPADVILKAFDWGSLPSESIVVDVGGGVGATSLTLAKNFSDVKIIVQDLPSVIEHAKLMWQKELPEAIQSGRVVLQCHDFYEAQPVTNAAIFVLKNIVHNWPDHCVVKFLSRLREVALQETKLIIIENHLPYACHNPGHEEGEEVPGAIPKEAPPPLLANYGIANRYVYDLDLVMLTELKGQERTVAHLADLLKQTGWRLTRIVRDHSCGYLQPAEAVPVF